MTDYKATSDQWNQVQKCADVVGSSDCSAILELRARIETLEAAAHKHVVETSANILALASRVESLEAAEREASKVYEISKPLKLTAKQQEELNALLRPSLKEQAQVELDRLIALIPTEGAIAMAEPIRRALEALPE